MLKTISTLCLQTLKVAIISTDEVPTQHNEPESKQDDFDYYQEEADISQRNVQRTGINFYICEKFYSDCGCKFLSIVYVSNSKVLQVCV